MSVTFYGPNNKDRPSEGRPSGNVLLLYTYIYYLYYFHSLPTVRRARKKTSTYAVCVAQLHCSCSGRAAIFDKNQIHFYKVYRQTRSRPSMAITRKRPFDGPKNVIFGKGLLPTSTLSRVTRNPVCGRWT